MGASILAGRQVLLTGATGFIGIRVTELLLEAGCRVAVLVRDTARLSRLGAAAAHVQAVQADVAQAASVERVEPRLAGDIIIHLAATGTDMAPQPAEVFIDVNIRGTATLMSLAQRGRTRRVVYTGSCAEYGAGARLTEQASLAPRSLYGFSKAAGWLAAVAVGRESGIPVTSVRLFTPFGPHERPGRLVANTIRHALAGQDIPLTPGDQTRDFLYLDDAAEAIMAAAAAGPEADYEAVNVCTGRETSVRELVTRVLALMGDPVRPLFGRTPYRPDEPGSMSGDPAKAARLLRWKARTPLDEGLRRTIAWWRTQHDRAPHDAQVGGRP